MLIGKTMKLAHAKRAQKNTQRKNLCGVQYNKLSEGQKDKSQEFYAAMLI